MNKIKKLIIFVLFLQTGAFAKAPTYDTFEDLVKEFQKDIKKLPQKISSSVLLNISVKGDIHESEYMEAQRIILLFIKALLQNEKDK